MARSPAAAGRARYKALATDGDGTLMKRKRMRRATAAALERLRDTGRRVVLATGETPEQLEKFPHPGLFDLVVGENGAILYWPASRAVRLLAEPPPRELLLLLRRRGLRGVVAGRVIVSTKRPHRRELARAVRELGLDWQVVLNRDEVMAVPAGVDKAAGLAAAAAELGLSPRELVGVGDGENDVPLLRFCGCGAAVASAVPALKRHADVETEGGPGDGVVELIDRLISDELPAPRRGRRKRAH